MSESWHGMGWVCAAGGGPFGQWLSQISSVVPQNLTIVVWSTEVGVGPVLQPKGLILLPPAPFWLLRCCCALLRYRWLWAKMGASSFSVREEWVCPSWAESQTKISINAYKLYTKLRKYCHMFHAVCAWQKPHLQLLLQVSLQKWACTGSSKGFPCSSLHITITALPTWTN